MTIPRNYHLTQPHHDNIRPPRPCHERNLKVRVEVKVCVMLADSTASNFEQKEGRRRGWRVTLVSGCEETRKSSPLDVLTAEMTQWQPLCLTDAEEELQLLPPWPVVQRVAPLFTSEMKSALKACMWRTGFGQDQLHPEASGVVQRQMSVLAGVLLRGRRGGLVGLCSGRRGGTTEFRSRQRLCASFRP